MKHHTKNKGDLGLMMVMAALAAHDIGICVPLSEHMPFDLIAVSSDGKLSRVQVKYRTAVNGTVKIPLKTSYADKSGSHDKTSDRSLFDAYAIFCPDNECIYYIRNDEIPSHYVNNMLLRIIPTANNQTAGIRMASKYQNALRLFEKQPIESMN
jgi:hypothetical protein